MNSSNPSGVRWSPSRVLLEYVEECKVLKSKVQVKVAPVVGKPNTGVSTSGTATVVQHPVPIVVVKCP